MNGTTTDWVWDWMIGFADVMEIVALVLPVCGLCMAAVIMLVPKIGIVRVTMSRRRAESIDASSASFGGLTAASSGASRLDGGLTCALPADCGPCEDRGDASLSQSAKAGPTRRGGRVRYGDRRSVVVVLTLLASLAALGPTARGQMPVLADVATTGPAPRAWHAMAYDSARGRVVLFGGNYANTNTFYGDTWEWDGATWTLRTTTGPAPRQEHAMAYDSARGVTVLFGGWSFSDTWEWDGASWTQR